MKVKYVNPFIKSSSYLFRDFLEMKIKVGDPFVLKSKYELYEVSAIIGLAGDTRGAVVLSFERNTAIFVVNKLSGQKHQALSNEVLDGVGELVNIIAGNAKKDLLEFHIKISLPGVIVGQKSKIHFPSGIPIVSIPVSSNAGDISINVSLRDLL